MNKLQKELTFSSPDVYFPGLRQQIDFMRRGKPITGTAGTITSNAERAAAVRATCAAAVQPTKVPPKTKAVYKFTDPDDPLFTKRLNKLLSHQRRKSSKVILQKGKDGVMVPRRDRDCCVFCCGLCACHSKFFRRKCPGRLGRETVSCYAA